MKYAKTKTSFIVIDGMPFIFFPKKKVMEFWVDGLDKVVRVDACSIEEALSCASKVQSRQKYSNSGLKVIQERSGNLREVEVLGHLER